METMSEPAVDAGGTERAGGRLLLRLYVAGSAPNSARAHANLLALLERAGSRDHRLEIVDCIQEPQRALQDGVRVTPTLLKLSPAPAETIIGTLSDARQVALTLGLLEGGGRTAEGGGPGDG
jgi:circadian clock protein KaiB